MKHNEALVKYNEFLETKSVTVAPVGFDVDLKCDYLFDFQKAVVKWALRRGRAAIFADTGLGKTRMQVEWAQQVLGVVGGKVLILAPLCVSQQTVEEAASIGVAVKYTKELPVKDGIWISNYERMDAFNFSEFTAVVLDESSILKHQSSKTRAKIISACKSVKYKLSCTATPSPNDYMELGNQAEFLGVMSCVEMLAMFFVHDGGETQKWRLKGHGASKFWEWLSTWAATFRRPSDLGFDDSKFILPELKFINHVVKTDKRLDGELFPIVANGLQDRIKARRETVAERVKECADLINESGGQWVVWCNLNSESSALARAINGAVEVSGADSIEQKELAIMGFTTGEVRVLVTKPSICGFGMNWQRCHSVAFVGLSDSYEEFYQAVRRCWRYGQKNNVDCHIFTADTEGSVLENIKRKERQAAKMHDSLVEHTKKLTQAEIKSSAREKAVHREQFVKGVNFTAALGDCVDVCRGLGDCTVDYSIFSPPFSSLYTYSNSDRDMGNCSGDAEFFGHFKFLIAELYRVTATGRNVSVHCMNLPTSKQNHGVIGLRDFRGEIIRHFTDAGFIYHSEVCIWKDPVIAMQRTKALGLLWKQLKKDSVMSRMGIPDYVVTFRKPGENLKPIKHTPEQFPVGRWQKVASPIWTDINPSNTLNRNGAREDEDERHIAPLQLDVIDRCIELWSNPGDLVFSPFMGIGSEGYCALKQGRKFCGVELKQSYFRLAVENLKEAKKTSEMGLFE